MSKSPSLLSAISANIAAQAQQGHATVSRGSRTGGVISEAEATPSSGCRSPVGGVAASSVIATSCGLGAMVCRAPDAALVIAATALPPASAAAAANCRSWFRLESCGCSSEGMVGYETGRGRTPKTVILAVDVRTHRHSCAVWPSRLCT